MLFADKDCDSGKLYQTISLISIQYLGSSDSMLSLRRSLVLQLRFTSPLCAKTNAGPRDSFFFARES